MEMIQNIAQAIDILRLSKGLTVAELCLDICDESSYRRYKTGKRDIPIARIKLFCDKLGIGLDEFLYNLTAKNSYEYKKIHKLFYDLQDKNYDQIKKSLPHIHVKEIALDKNKTLFEFIVYTYQFEIKKLTKSEYYSLLTDLLPVQNGFYTFNHIIILEKLAWLEIGIKEPKSLENLQAILLDTKRLYATNHHHAVIATMYANVANIITKSKEFESALILCDKGISYSNKYNVTKNIHYLYYIKAYCLFQNDEKDAAMQNLSIVVSLVFAMQDKKKFKYFIEIIMKEFNLTKPMIYQMHQLSLENYL